MTRTTHLIQLVASIVAFLTAVIGLWIVLDTRAQLVEEQRRIEQQGNQIALQNAQIAKHSEELQKIQALASQMALKAIIHQPLQNEHIPPVYDDMKGRFTGNIPFGHNLRVLAKDRYNYFAVYPATQYIHADQTWTQTNVRLATNGRWQLLLCIANTEASLWLQTREDNSNLAGFSTLPNGLQILKTVYVVR